MEAESIRKQIKRTAFAFRGYNFTNLGRTGELLAHQQFGPTVEKHLNAFSEIATESLARPVDLAADVRSSRDTTLETYGEAIALIVAVELAQLELLRDHFSIHLDDAQCCFGYSLGEISALIASSVMPAEAVSVPLRLAEDCAALASGVSLAVLISRSDPIPLNAMRRACIHINQQGDGVMGVSAYLSPNSCLLMGQGTTLDRFKAMCGSEDLPKLMLRKNEHRWPPLHTPIVWNRNIPNRSAVMMHTIRGELRAPTVPIISMVTGKPSYNDYNAREILHRWADHPQRLWDVIGETLQSGTECVLHIGPAPNILPATFKRLSDNVEVQTKGSIAMRALSAAVNRPWLRKILPQSSNLLRAPDIKHIIVEDWLLDQRHGTTT